jgi:O-acetyl-ADP-ribose deacetylase (regulator of RNase III)
MGNLSIIRGNIFRSKCQTIVNTVNCVGIMGAGIALECRLRYPKMYLKYVKLCEDDALTVGKLWLYKTSDRWILNFPTKIHWKNPSKEEYLHAGLARFVDTYVGKGISSIAFPLLGAQHGGLTASRSEEIMASYLCRCEIPIEIYHYDSSAEDDLYDAFRLNLLGLSEGDIKARTGLKLSQVRSMVNALHNPSINQLGQLAMVKGIGVATLERLFAFAADAAANSTGSAIQPSLEL